MLRLHLFCVLVELAYRFLEVACAFPFAFPVHNGATVNTNDTIGLVIVSREGTIVAIRGVILIFAEAGCADCVFGD